MSDVFSNPLLDDDGEEEVALPLPSMVSNSDFGSTVEVALPDVALPSVPDVVSSVEGSPVNRPPVESGSSVVGEDVFSGVDELGSGSESGSVGVDGFVGGADDLDVLFGGSLVDEEEVVPSSLSSGGEGVSSVELSDFYNTFGGDEEEEDPFGGFDIDAVLCDAIDAGASDVDVLADQPVEFTILGEQVRQLQYPIPSDMNMLRVQQDLVSNVLNDDFVLDLELDASYVIRKGRHKGRRLRLSVGKTFGTVFLCFRVISDRIPSLEELKVSEELASWARLPKGLVLMNGATGTGKALHVGEVVPTPSGLVKVGDVSVGDVLFDERGAVCRVVEVHSSDDDVFFEVGFRSGVKVRAAAGHLWSVHSGDAVCSVLSTAELAVGLRGGAVFYTPAISGAIMGGLRAPRVDFAAVGSLLRRGCVERLSMTELSKLFGGLCRGLSLEVFLERLPFYPLAERLLLLSSVFDLPGVDVVVSLPVSGVVGAALRSSVASVGGSAVLVDGVLSVALQPRSGGLSRGVDVLGAGEVVSVVEVSGVRSDYLCFEVDSPSHLFLCSSGFLPTHNSTTLASMVREVQLTRKQKIITIEKPVEYVYGKDGKALVMQREVGRDTRSFGKALESAMRQHPNIILVGEVRNKTEVDALLYAADSGHLAISTTHATSASASLNRIKGFYQGDDLMRVLSSFGELARGLASQALLKTPDGRSRFAVREVLSVNDEVADLISAGDVKGIQRYQDERGITMEHELVRAVRMGFATLEEARSKTDRPYRFDKIYDSSFAK